MTLDAHATGIWCGQIGGGGVCVCVGNFRYIVRSRADTTLQDALFLATKP